MAKSCQEEKERDGSRGSSASVEAVKMGAW